MREKQDMALGADAGFGVTENLCWGCDYKPLVHKRHACRGRTESPKQKRGKNIRGSGRKHTKKSEPGKNPGN